MAPLMSSHFPTEHSVLREAAAEEEEEESRIVEEKPVPVREFGSRAPDEYNHSHHKLMAMADVAAYTQQSTWTYQCDDLAGRPYWQHPLLTPVTSTSPQEYPHHNDCFPSASATDAATQANHSGSICDEDGTDIDNSGAINDRDAVSYATPPTVGGGMNEISRKGVKAISEGGKKHEAPKVIHLCQYTDTENNVWGPCNENRNPEDINARKIVSHIFGRNKKPTQNIPDELWIWYCRKHYQRSKYTCSNQWPQKQVDLVRLALDNFEKWGEILYWNVVLRKREQDRQERTRRSAISMDSPTGEPFYFAASPRRRTAPARNSIGKVARSQKALATAAAAAGHLPEALNLDSIASRNPHPGLTPTGRRKASPKNVPCPVPGFVYPYLGERRSFTMVRHLIDQIENYIQGKDKTVEQFAREAEEEEVHGQVPEVRRFPDIEILPVFTTRYQRLMDKKDEDGKREKKSNLRAVDVSLSQSSSKTAKIYKNAANSDVYRDAGRGYHYQAAAAAAAPTHQSHHHPYLQLSPPPQLSPANPQFHLPPPVPQHATHTHSTLIYPTHYREFTSYTPSQQHTQQHDGRAANAQPHNYFQQHQQHQQQEGRSVGLPLPSFHSQFPLPDY